MVEQSTKQAADPTVTDVRMMRRMKEGAGAMAMCPMANVCMGMTAKSPSGFLLMLPGALLVVVGVLILIEPKVLGWLVAGASILLGIILLMIANFIRRFGARLRSVHPHA
ncbi:MAG: hypothetical protein ACE5NW_07910 [Acidiferrobacterales bacterium]